jgi:hypothetical protein
VRALTYFFLKRRRRRPRLLCLPQWQMGVKTNTCTSRTKKKRFSKHRVGRGGYWRWHDVAGVGRWLNVNKSSSSSSRGGCVSFVFIRTDAICIQIRAFPQVGERERERGRARKREREGVREVSPGLPHTSSLVTTCDHTVWRKSEPSETGIWFTGAYTTTLKSKLNQHSLYYCNKA